MYYTSIRIYNNFWKKGFASSFLNFGIIFPLRFNFIFFYLDEKKREKLFIQIAFPFIRLTAQFEWFFVSRKYTEKNSFRFFCLHLMNNAQFGILLSDVVNWCWVCFDLWRPTTSHYNHHRHRHWGYHGTSCLSQYIQPGPECNSWPLFKCILYGPILMISDISSCSIKAQYENYTKFRILLQQQWAFELLKLRDIHNLLIFCFLFMLHSTTMSEWNLLRISWTFAQCLYALYTLYYIEMRKMYGTIHGREEIYFWHPLKR